MVFGEGLHDVILIIRNIAGPDDVTCKALYPGVEEFVALESGEVSGSLQIRVPLVRGCAMVKIESK